MNRLAALTLIVAVAACSSPAGTAPTQDATPPSLSTPATSPPVSDFAAIAASACADTTYRRCIESLISMSELVPGSLVAVCDYSDGTGDVVIIEREADAEAECSGDGLISPSRVVTVVQLPG
jgi:hypothetical protein